jgi:hypothetical protein
MALSKKGKLSLSLFTLVYTWEDKLENEYCSIDMLLLGTCMEDQTNVTVDKTRKNLCIEYTYPSYFLDPNHLSLSSGGASNAADHKSALSNKSVSKLNSCFDDQNPNGVLICGLPFKCDRSLFCNANHNGLEVVCYDSGETVMTGEAQTV